MCYATLAFVTDYDCWREDSEPVSVEAVVRVLKDNAGAARLAMREAIRLLSPERSCACRGAMRYAVLTDPRSIPEATKARLKPIVGRYL